MVRKSYEESNLERQGDEARLYETLQGINYKGSVKGTAQPEYLAMSDHFSRQSSKVEEVKSLIFEPGSGDVAEMNYVQMEPPSSSSSLKKANLSS